MSKFDEYSSKLSGSVSSNVKDTDASNIYLTGEGTNNDPYAVEAVLGNWYKQKPYAFEFGSKEERNTRTFYLPIAPSNLNITTHFATSVISTMYGTVEEHSDQRYYDITISGTTGMSPKYYKEIEDQLKESSGDKHTGRATAEIKNNISGAAGGFFERTLSLAQNALNQASDILGEEENTTGIDLQRTGYAAFHNFYKFLLVHKKVAAGENIKYKTEDKTLRFINYKDNNQYDVAIQNFQLTRDASNPMLYNYNITMRAYNMRSADSQGTFKDVSDRAASLGLNGVDNSSLFSKISNKVKKAKNAAYSAIGAVRGFGS